MKNQLNFLVLSSLLFTAPSLAADCGKVTTAKGKVEVLRIKDSSADEIVRQAVKAKKRMKIECRDILVTHKSSRAKLRLQKAIITVGPNSRLEIEEEIKKTGQQQLGLPYGKIRTFFKGKEKAGQATQFKVKTPAAVVGVRGTDFYVAYKPNEKVTEQATVTGSVEVIQNKTNIAVEVKEGSQVRVDNFEAKLRDKIAEQEKAAPTKLTEEQKKELETQLAAKEQEKLIVEKLEKVVVQDIRSISTLVQNDPEFTSPKAIEVLGETEKWVPPAQPIPEKFKKYKNEF